MPNIDDIVEKFENPHLAFEVYKSVLRANARISSANVAQEYEAPVHEIEKIFNFFYEYGVMNTYASPEGVQAEMTSQWESSLVPTYAYRQSGMVHDAGLFDELDAETDVHLDERPYDDG